MAVWDGGTAPLTTLGAAPQARHLGGSTGFVNEDELAGIKLGLSLEPGFARRLHVTALLLAGMRRLFLKVMARLLKNSQTVDGTAEMPRSAKSLSAISPRLMSGRSSTIEIGRAHV
jgi:hypothetical protein